MFARRALLARACTAVAQAASQCQLRTSAWVARGDVPTDHERLDMSGAGPRPGKHRAPPRHDVLGEEGSPDRVMAFNLPYDADWCEVVAWFERAGSVVYACVHRDREGNSKGRATVEFGTPCAAQRAVALLHGKPFNGRRVKVYPDESSPQKRLRDEDRGLLVPGAQGRQIVVTGLPFAMSDDDFVAHVQAAVGAGAVVAARVARRQDGLSAGFGKAVLATEAEAERACGKLDGREVGGRRTNALVDTHGGAGGPRRREPGQREAQWRDSAFW
ncbi:unnamed protein product [Pedinophyceae sp. YPF-701]|nr:unnamed protein product [Pedinophyceae sp. YPF-701]